MWGIRDQNDGTWLGDDDGPKLFDEEVLARIAAQVADEQLGQPPGSSRAAEFESRALRLRDTVATKMSPLLALKRLEGRSE